MKRYILPLFLAATPALAQPARDPALLTLAQALAATPVMAPSVASDRIVIVKDRNACPAGTHWYMQMDWDGRFQACIKDEK